MKYWIIYPRAEVCQSVLDRADSGRRCTHETDSLLLGKCPQERPRTRNETALHCRSRGSTDLQHGFEGAVRQGGPRAERRGPDAGVLRLHRQLAEQAAFLRVRQPSPGGSAALREAPRSLRPRGGTHALAERRG